MRLIRLTALLYALSVLAACSHKATPPPPPAPEVGVVTLREQSVPVFVDLTGRTTSTLASDVRPQVDGIVTALLYKEGSVVHAGQPLYQIDPRPYEATRDQAAATLENAKAALVAAQLQATRYLSLSDTDAASRQTIDNAVATARQDRATVSQDAASLRSAQINLAYTVVRAPITGRIGRSAVTVGALVTSSQTAALATIESLNPIFVDMTQSMEAFTGLRRSLARGAVRPSGAIVHLSLPDGTAYAQAGRLEFAETVVDPNSGTVTLRARFPNPDGMLFPGMFVQIKAPQGVVPNGILAPQQGITRDPKGNATALIVGPGNKVAQVTATTVEALGDKWLVDSGLKAGDRLIVDGANKIQPGAVVTPTAADLAE